MNFLLGVFCFFILVTATVSKANPTAVKAGPELITQLRTQKAPLEIKEVHPLVEVHDDFWARLRKHQTGGNGALKKLRAATQKTVSDKSFAAYIGNLKDLPDEPEKKGPLMSYMRGESQYVVQTMVLDNIPYYAQIKKGYNLKFNPLELLGKLVDSASQVSTSSPKKDRSNTASLSSSFKGRKYGLILKEINPPTSFNEYQFVSMYNDDTWEHFDAIANKADVTYDLGPLTEDSFKRPVSHFGDAVFADPPCRSPIFCNPVDLFLDTRLDIKATPNMGGVESSAQQSTPTKVKNIPLSYIVSQESGFIRANAKEVNYKLQWDYHLNWPLYQNVSLGQDIDKDHNFIQSALNIGLGPLKLSGNFKLNVEHKTKKIGLEWRNVF